MTNMHTQNHDPACAAPVPAWRKDLLDLLAIGMEQEEAAVELAIDSRDIRGRLSDDDDLRKALTTRRRRLMLSLGDWLEASRARYRLALEKGMDRVNASILRLLARLYEQHDPPPLALSGEPSMSCDGEEQAWGGRHERLCAFSARDIARWWWFEIHEGTPEPARRLLPDHYPEGFEASLRDLGDDLADVLRLRGEALGEAERSIGEPRPGDAQLYPELARMRTARHDEARLSLDQGLVDTLDAYRMHRHQVMRSENSSSSDRRTPPTGHDALLPPPLPPGPSSETDGN
ncbi:MAG: hypothetical protein R3C97_00315 [Geminicoccaceae bacterium]